MSSQEIIASNQVIDTVPFTHLSAQEAQALLHQNTGQMIDRLSNGPEQYLLNLYNEISNLIIAINELVASSADPNFETISEKLSKDVIDCFRAYLEFNNDMINFLGNSDQNFVEASEICIDAEEMLKTVQAKITIIKSREPMVMQPLKRWAPSYNKDRTTQADSELEHIILKINHDKFAKQGTYILNALVASEEALKKLINMANGVILECGVDLSDFHAEVMQSASPFFNIVVNSQRLIAKLKAVLADIKIVINVTDQIQRFEPSFKSANGFNIDETSEHNPMTNLRTDYQQAINEYKTRMNEVSQIINKLLTEYHQQILHIHEEAETTNESKNNYRHFVSATPEDSALPPIIRLASIKSQKFLIKSRLLPDTFMSEVDCFISEIESRYAMQKALSKGESMGLLAVSSF